MERRVAIVTGSSRGIGATTAQVLARDGWNVVLTGRDTAALQQAATACERAGAQALPVVGDLAKEEDITALFAIVDQHFPRIDALINNAAISGQARLLEMSRAEWERFLNINLTAPFRCAQLAGQRMAAAGSGVIINVSSVVEKQAMGVHAAYGAAKGGLQALTRELATTLGSRGVRAVTVSPGHIETGISDQWSDDTAPWINHFVDLTPLQRGGTADEVAEVIAFLASSKASFVTGTEIVVDGGRLAALYPKSLREP